MSEAKQSVGTGNAARPREKQVKGLEVGCQVSGSFGETWADFANSLLKESAFASLPPQGASKKSGKKRRAGEDDPHGRMPGQLYAETPPKDYTQHKAEAVANIKALHGQEVVT